MVWCYGMVVRLMLLGEPVGGGCRISRKLIYGSIGCFILVMNSFDECRVPSQSSVVLWSGALNSHFTHTRLLDRCEQDPRLSAESAGDAVSMSE